jgi:hypothetical protein
MPKIVDPDNLIRNTSVIFDISSPDARFIEVSSSLENTSSLVPPLSSGSDSGLTMQSLYSFCKEQWKSQADLIKIPFPLISITKNQFDFINNWDYLNDNSRYLIRDGAWSVISASITIQEWVGIVSLGVLGATDQVYYQQSSSLEPAVNFKMSGSVNQAIQHFSASFEGTDFNKRSFTKLFVREYKKSFDDASIQDDLSVPVQEYVVYSLPLVNATDLKISTTSEGEATGSPYNEVSIAYLTGSGFGAYATATGYETGSVVQGTVLDNRWYHNPLDGGTSSGADPGADVNITWVTWSLANGGGERQVGADYYAYNIIVNAGAGQNNSKEQVYTRAQYELRLNTEIDDGGQDPVPHTGKVSDLLMSFLGDTLITANGVFIDNFQDADTNAIEFYDVSGSQRLFPFVATGLINFNDNLQSDLQAEYFMFFTSIPSGSFGSASAVIVEDNANALITGSVSGSSSVSFTFDYDGNAQGGRTTGSDAPVTVVAIGLDTAQYVSAVGTIARSKTNVITLVSAVERNYSNP